ncbi:MAG: hypothetical protein Q4G66_06600 [bacterium]|nr:hypothetical protein [bacterium]
MQIKNSNTPFAPLKSLRPASFPLTVSGRVKSGALEPKGSWVEAVNAVFASSCKEYPRLGKESRLTKKIFLSPHQKAYPGNEHHALQAHMRPCRRWYSRADQENTLIPFLYQNPIGVGFGKRSSEYLYVRLRRICLVSLIHFFDPETE